MPKSFLFSHKRYDFHDQNHLGPSSTIKFNENPPPTLTNNMKINTTECNKSSTFFIKSEPPCNLNSRKPGGGGPDLVPSWGTPITKLIANNNTKPKAFEKITRRYADRYHAETKEKFTKITNKMCIKVPALISLSNNSNNSNRGDWKHFNNTDCEYQINHLQNNEGLKKKLPKQENNNNEEQPVNLSVKKIDLFNLNQLAEVSLATAEGRSFSSPNIGLSTTIYPSETFFSKSDQQNSNTSDDYEMGELRICESPELPPIPKLIKQETTTSRLEITRHPTPTTPTTTELTSELTNSAEEIYSNPVGCGAGVVDSSTSSVTPNLSATAAASGRHKCLECGKGFSTLSNLARHRQTHRSLSDTSAVKKCPHCDKVYVSMPAFSMHLRTHNQGCKCPYCGKGFSRPWLLQGHIRTHTGEKPFKCSICAKAFADKSNLRAHTQTHSSEKPFICSRCRKPFALKSYLCKHIESSCMKTSRSPSSSSSSLQDGCSDEILADPVGLGGGGASGDSSCSSFSTMESNDSS